MARTSVQINRQETGVRVRGFVVDPIDPWPVVDLDPTSGLPLAEIRGGGKHDAAEAMAAATEALVDWGESPPKQRSDGLRRIATNLREKITHEALASLVARETGKRIAEARAEVGLSAAFFDWFADAIASRRAEVWEVVPGIRHEVSWRPLGVVAAITPWNFPVSIPARKISAAVAAGCTVVFRPSEIAPLASLRLAEIMDEHLPAGVVNTVIGPSRAIAEAWLSDPRLSGLTFTGSTPVGQALAERALARMTRCVLELGGKAPFVVLDDVDIGRAAAFLASAKYRNNGQSCIAADQVWVPRVALEAFTESFVEISECLILGDPLDESTSLGPLAKSTDPERIGDLLTDAESHGSEVVRTSVRVPQAGHFVAPAICLNPRPDARIAVEEIFGPVLTMQGYDDIEDVIKAIDASPHGLGGYVAGRDLYRAAAIGRRLSVGIVGINSATPNTPQIPFAGMRLSGLGVEGSELGLEAFMSPHSIAVGQ